MFDHVDLPVNDVAASVAFYRLVLAALGYAQTSGEPPEFGALSFVHRDAPEPLHVAFIAESQAAVEAFHRVGDRGRVRKQRSAQYSEVRVRLLRCLPRRS